MTVERALSMLDTAYAEAEAAAPYIDTDKVVRARYMQALDDLSSAYGKLCWANDWDDQDVRRLFQETSVWIHDWNRWLWIAKNSIFFKTFRELTEKQLPCIDRLLNEGFPMREFYTTAYFAVPEKNTRIPLVERMLLITEEMTGIRSPILPRYYPVTRPLVTDASKIEDHIRKDFSFHDKKLCISRWHDEELPVLLWINRHLAKDDTYVHDLWRSDYGTRQNERKERPAP